MTSPRGRHKKVYISLTEIPECGDYHARDFSRQSQDEVCPQGEGHAIFHRVCFTDRRGYYHGPQGALAATTVGPGAHDVRYVAVYGGV